MVCRWVLVTQILGMLVLAIYTVRGQAEVWRQGHELAALSHRSSREAEKSKVLEMLLTRARSTEMLGEKAQAMHIVLTEPAREKAPEPASSHSVRSKRTAQAVSNSARRSAPARRARVRRF
ncbi:MAG: hypothetical protein HYU36_07115 [Planctomycetes bacterium]|nr:hypothetical protein [Planctomycetota bacterium]